MSCAFAARNRTFSRPVTGWISHSHASPRRQRYRNEYRAYLSPVEVVPSSRGHSFRDLLPRLEDPKVNVVRTNAAKSNGVVSFVAPKVQNGRFNGWGSGSCPESIERCCSTSVETGEQVPISIEDRRH